ALVFLGEFGQVAERVQLRRAEGLLVVPDRPQQALGNPVLGLEDLVLAVLLALPGQLRVLARPVDLGLLLALDDLEAEPVRHARPPGAAAPPGGQRAGPGGRAPPPAAQPLARPDRPRPDRLAGQEAAQVVLQLAGGLVAAAGVFLEALQADGFQVAGDLVVEA